MPLLLLVSTGASEVSAVTVFDTVTDNALAIHQNSDFTYQFTVLSDAVAADITGAAFTGMFRWQFSDASPVFSLTTEISVVDATGGIALIQIPYTDTTAVVVPTTGIQNIIGGGYDLYYDINMLLEGRQHRVLRGVAKFYQSALQ